MCDTRFAVLLLRVPCTCVLQTTASVMPECSGPPNLALKRNAKSPFSQLLHRKPMKHQHFLFCEIDPVLRHHLCLHFYTENQRKLNIFCLARLIQFSICFIGTNGPLPLSWIIHRIPTEIHCSLFDEMDSAFDPLHRCERPLMLQDQPKPKNSRKLARPQLCHF